MNQKLIQGQYFTPSFNPNRENYGNKQKGGSSFEVQSGRDNIFEQKGSISPIPFALKFGEKNSLSEINSETEQSQTINTTQLEQIIAPWKKKVEELEKQLELLISDKATFFNTTPKSGGLSLTRVPGNSDISKKAFAKKKQLTVESINLCEQLNQQILINKKLSQNEIQISNHLNKLGEIKQKLFAENRNLKETLKTKEYLIKVVSERLKSLDTQIINFKQLQCEKKQTNIVKTSSPQKFSHKLSNSASYESIKMKNIVIENRVLKKQLKKSELNSIENSKIVKIDIEPQEVNSYKNMIVKNELEMHELKSQKIDFENQIKSLKEELLALQALKKSQI